MDERMLYYIVLLGCLWHRNVRKVPLQVKAGNERGRPLNMYFVIRPPILSGIYNEPYRLFSLISNFALCPTIHLTKSQSPLSPTQSQTTIPVQPSPTSFLL
jgi:hypothetical protein